MSKVITREQVGEDVQPWEMPEVDSSSDESLYPPEDDANYTARDEGGSSGRSLLTLEQIEAIEQEAREEGFASGHRDGVKEGRKRGHEEGLKLGRDEGFRLGHEEGKAQGLQEAAQCVANLQQVLDHLSAPLSELDEAVEQELVQLALAVARQVVHAELQSPSEHILQVVREAVAVLPSSQRPLKIHLTAADLTLVKEHLIDDEHAAWQLIEDPGITPGGCKIEAEISSVDATVEQRLDSVIRAALGKDDEHDSTSE